MTRPLAKLVALCLLLLVVLQSPALRQPPAVFTTRPSVSTSPSQSPSWDGLRDAIDARNLWIRVAGESVPSAAPPVTRSRYGTGACGGDLPPCSVLLCESGGNLTAQNPHSTASGKWQILDSTWAGYGGYSRAMYAPESVQDAKARLLYRGGAGRSQWVC